jgi:hypothetical protein
MTTPDKKLASDIAKSLDRRRAGRRVLVLLVLAAAIALAVMYLTCGSGFGLGGKGKGKGEGKGEGDVPRTAISADAGPTRCTIRISADGIMIGGKLVAREVAVTKCKATSGADVVVTGDARQGDWDELRSALEAAGVAVYVKQKH